MHLCCLGCMKKLLVAWIKSGFERTKLSQSSICTVSAYLIAIAPDVPCDFPRKTRTLNDLPHMKATEHRLHMNYVAPVAFKHVLSQPLYNHFMLFHVAMKLLVNDEDCQAYVPYAEKLLKAFVKDSIKLYGPKFVSYNIHNLIHLPSDVLTFGNLDKFSSFPFENKLQQMKTLIRRGGKPLEQIVRRMREIDANNARTNTGSPLNTAENRFASLSDGHHSGPLIYQFGHADQFKTMQYGRWKITNKRPNNCVFTTDRKVVIIENILRTANSEIFILGKQYITYNNLFEYPLPSMMINEFVVSDLIPFLMYGQKLQLLINVSEFLCKFWKMASVCVSIVFS